MKYQDANAFSGLRSASLRGTTLVAALAFVLCAARATALTPARPVHSPAPSVSTEFPEIVPGIRADHAVAPAALYARLARVKRFVPSFSRQTGLACSSCHYQFPQLTPFGRLFKLNGYTLTGLPTIGQPGDSAGHESLKLLSVPPIAAMVVASDTRTNKTEPGTQNWSAQLPQQFSIFAAGQISPHVGAFTQFTYAASDGSLGIDNIDIRYANHASMGDRDVAYGVTLHNNPTVQDVWNTVPAWGFPFMGSGTAPSPAASALIDGALGQQVVGLGAYSLFNNVLYGEFTMYRAAQQGTAQPFDETSTNVSKGVIPYWRVALQHAGESTYAMLGTYGFSAGLYPTGVTGLTDHYTDAAVDAQVEHKAGEAMWIGRAAYIHEKQRLNASARAEEPTAEGVDHTLSTLRASLQFQPNLHYGLTAGYFQISGTSDPLRFPTEGSEAGSPNSSGALAEFNYNAWQNARIGVQYVSYFRFDGLSGSRGDRSASDKNTLYLYTWLAF